LNVIQLKENYANNKNQAKMKNRNIKLMSAVLAATLAFSGCSKDEETPAKTNSFSFQSKTYETPKGFIEFWGPESDNKSANFDILLVSAEVSYDAASDEYTTNPNYDYVYFELNSSSLTELVSGTYTYDNVDWELDELVKPNTFSDAGVGVDVVDESESVDDEYGSDETTTGTVTVNKSGSTYEITYSVKLENNKMVEGYYKGTLTAIDYSDEGAMKSATLRNHKVLGFKR